MKLFTWISFAVLSSTATSDSNSVGYTVIDDYNTTLLKTGPKGSKLYSIDVEEIGQGTAYLMDLHGESRYDMGYDQGVLIGNLINDSMQSLLDILSGGDQVLNIILEELFLWQWNIALSHQTPSEYLDELRGTSDGSKFANPDAKYDAGNLCAVGIVVANLPGDADDVVYVLMNELPLAKISQYEALLGEKLDVVLKRVHWLHPGCSNFGAWGSRTPSGEVYTGRNLDWEADTGVNQQKLVTVWHPTDGYAHATIGFAGLIGAITGISEKGLTVHEANLESDLDTFFGFPWTLRLRYIMEQASNLAEASALWAGSNNTCGFIQAVGSNNEESGSPMFMILETDAGHTATFFDMDAREASASNGDPRSEALYRTNHGYDPQTIAHYQWNGTGADTNSNQRYQLFPPIFDNITLGSYDISQAIFTAAVLGDKGSNRSQFHECIADSYPKANNVISAAFAPKDGAGVLYAAWEVGSGESWVPACCSAYVKVDLSQWW